MLKLYTYFRSSAAYRVRIALNLKGLDYSAIPVHLLRGGGEQHTPAYREINPAGTVPTLVDGTLAIGQSLAIIEYLEETHPCGALLPATAQERARVRSLALTVACEIHPLNNLRVLKYLGDEFAVDEARRSRWYRHWVEEGFRILEARLSGEPQTGRFCHGDRPGLADCCLIPQVFNAERFQVDLAPYPVIRRIHQACAGLPAFAAAHPAQQADAE